MHTRLLVERICLLFLLFATTVGCFVPQPTDRVGTVDLRHTHGHAAVFSFTSQWSVNKQRSYTFLLQSSFPWEEPTPAQNGEDETLLRVRLSVDDGVKKDKALDKVQSYTQGFPFAAILPVQPLQYLPTHDGGVDVLFLRKKTKEKGSVDGGIRFFVQADETGEGIEVLAKRNSKGQVVSKGFTEKLVIQAYVKGISGQADDRTGAAPSDMVSVESVFHKWL